jgi:hypothetical protein
VSSTGFGDQGMKALIELRQRSKGYEPVSTDDDYDTVPTHFDERIEPNRLIAELREDNSHESLDFSPKKTQSKSCKLFAMTFFDSE